MIIWETLTAPQATILSGVLTIIAAIVGVLLGSALFGGRVKNLEGALKQTTTLMETYEKSLNHFITESRDKFDVFNVSFSSTFESLGQLRSAVEENHEAVVDAASGEQNDAEENEQTDHRAQFKNYWVEIRDAIEQAAASPEIDGRTRARYARLDRRQYFHLIEVLSNENRLHGKGALFQSALALWNKYKNGRLDLPIADVSRMSDLRHQLVG